jgi:PAS domain S-box-containing protein
MGIDAQTVLAHTSFDLVLLDLQLPDMPGVELLRCLARESIMVPTLIVTAHGNEHLARDAFQAGALDYVVKDKDGGLTFLDDLPKRVAEAVTRHRLQQMNRLLIASLESAGDGIMITDLQGNVLHVNSALEQMSGYSRDELVGQNPRLFISALHPDDFFERIWPTVLARNVWQGELTNRCKDGRLYEVSLTFSPVLDALGQLTHLIGILRDVSERKRLEQQLIQAQKMQSVGTLAGGVAHEFNNLLAGISGYAALAQRDLDLDNEAREFMDNIMALSERAAGLTRQLLTYARKSELVRRPTRMAELLTSTAELVRRTLCPEVTLDLSEQANDSHPLAVIADANHLQQALINLTLNARDAVISRERKGTASRPDARVPEKPSMIRSPIVLRLRQAVLANELPTFPQNIPPGDYVVVDVVDRGCGMTAEVLSQSIDPFFTTKEVGQGSGLGLPMVFGIVQGHQGYLAIESTPGQGTCVSLYLPRLAKPTSDEASRPIFAAGQVIEPESTPGRNILVVDDEEAILDVIRRFLEIAGHQVHCVTSGREAIEYLATDSQIDLVVLDLMMPQEDGANTYERMRQLCPNLPVLMCTGLPQGSPLPASLAAGAASFLRKPFRMNELWYAVRQALDGSSPRPAALLSTTNNTNNTKE